MTDSEECMTIDMINSVINIQRCTRCKTKLLFSRCCHIILSAYSASSWNSHSEGIAESRCQNCGSNLLFSRCSHIITTYPVSRYAHTEGIIPKDVNPYSVCSITCLYSDISHAEGNVSGASSNQIHLCTKESKDL